MAVDSIGVVSGAVSWLVGVISIRGGGCKRAARIFHYPVDLDHAVSVDRGQSCAMGRPKGDAHGKAVTSTGAYVELARRA